MCRQIVATNDDSNSNSNSDDSLMHIIFAFQSINYSIAWYKVHFFFLFFFFLFFFQTKWSFSKLCIYLGLSKSAHMIFTSLRIDWMGEIKKKKHTHKSKAKEEEKKTNWKRVRMTIVGKFTSYTKYLPYRFDAIKPKRNRQFSNCNCKMQKKNLHRQQQQRRCKQIFIIFNCIRLHG